MKKEISNKNLKLIEMGISNKKCFEHFFIDEYNLNREVCKLFDTLCSSLIIRNIASIREILQGLDYIYTSLSIEPTPDQISHDIDNDLLTINVTNNNEEVLIYMAPNGDYYAYNLTNDYPEDGEEFEKRMGWQ